jgi:hypothetical protein
VIGFDLPWFLLPLILILTAPWLALAGAIAFGYLTYRFTSRARGLKASLAAIAGAQIVPLLALTALEGASGGGATTRLIGVGFLAFLSVVILVITRFFRAPPA